MPGSSYASVYPLPTVEGYSIEECLGEGGMGVVYRARERRTNQVVALKMLSRVDPAGIYRLKREFRLLADIVHHNLVRLIELQCDEQSCFFTMELVRGRRFLDYLGVNPWRRRAEPATEGDSPTLVSQEEPEPESGLKAIPIDEALVRDAFVQLVHGVAAIHQANKLHCDLKPSNLLVDDRGRVVVLDFGVSTGFGANEPFRTFEGEVAGTPEYMSPEQAAGKAVGPASDWYAVGVMLYEVLTGTLPFTGAKLSLMEKKQVEDPPPPSSLRANVPSDLDELCMALLVRDPEKRPTEAEILKRLAPAESWNLASRSLLSSETPPTFVGRDAELSALLEAFEAVQPGAPVVTLLSGGSGIGKTALLHRFFDQVTTRPGVVFLRGRCYERESVPYKAFDPLIDELSRMLRRLTDREVAEVLPRDIRALSRVFPVLNRVRAVAAARGRSAEGADLVELRRRATAAFKELLAKLGDRFRIVLSIDDLQWGDLDSARMLIDLLEPPDAPSLLVVLCARDGNEHECPMLRELFAAGDGGPALEGVRRVPLRELGELESQALAESLLGGGPDSELARLIARESRGNPFFVRELSHHAGAAGEAPGLGLSPMIERRVNALPSELRALLELMAVAAHPVPHGVLIGLFGEQVADTGSLLRLRDAHLVRLHGAPRAFRIECYHDRVREAVLASLDDARVAECHRLLARALEQSGSADPEVLLEHYRRAGALGRARRHVLRSARAATEALAFARATRLYQLALELGPPKGRYAWVLERRLADALANEGRLHEAAEAFERAASGREGLEAVELRRLAAQHYLSSGHTERGLAVLAKVLSEVGLEYPKTPGAALGRLAIERARLRLFGLRFVEREASTIPPLELARIDVCFSAAVGLAMSDLARTAAFSAQHLRLALRSGEPMRIARGLAFEMGVAPGAGEEGMRWANRALPIAEQLSNRHGDAYHRGLFFLAQGHVAHLSGQWKAAIDWLARAEKSLREAQTPEVHWALLSGNVLAAVAAVVSGDLTVVGQRLPALLKEARQRGDLYSLALMLYPNVLLNLARDRPEAAARLLSEANAASDVFSLREFTALHCQLLVARYTDDVEGAWRRLSETWPAIERSKILLVNVVRVSALAERGAAAVAMIRAGHVGSYEKIARQCAKKLSKETLLYARAFSTLLTASIHRALGDSRRALSALSQASLELETAGMAIHAMCARRNIGAVMGDEIGRVLVAEIDATLRNQGVRNPRRFAEMMAPGFDIGEEHVE